MRAARARVLVSFGDVRVAVIPAKAGIQFLTSCFQGLGQWIPAFAGMIALRKRSHIGNDTATRARGSAARLPSLWYCGCMASQKVTFSLPKNLVAQLAKRVPVRERSRYVAEALATKLKEREQLLAHACEMANRSRKIRALERDWDVLTDEIREPWGDASSG